MRRVMALGLAAVMLAGLIHCASEDPDLRRGNVFFKSRKWYEAMQAYEKAYARDPKLFENPELRENFKNAYYYYGGTRESGDSVEAAVKYYEKGFELIPGDMNICAKLADYYQSMEEWEKVAHYEAKMVELISNAADSQAKWDMLGRDYYALGYALYQQKKYDEAIEAFQQSIKAAPKGQFAAKAKSAKETAAFDKKNKK